MKMNEVIKEKRKALDLTQEQLAAYLGVTAPAVHKWEKGISMPDVMILPTLARILKTDLNTLFSFEKEITEQEISIFCNEVIQKIQEDGYDAGFKIALEKVREFPYCEKLIFNLASLLDGGLTIFCVEERENYSAEIEELYERAAKAEDERIRNSANQLLIYKALQNQDFEKAEKLWRLLPESVPDKKMIEANICNYQEKYDEATRILEERLYSLAAELQNCLVNLLQTFEKTAKNEEMQFCAETLKRHIDNLGLWKYGKYLAEYQLALAGKDEEKAAEVSQKMLDSVEEDYCLHDFMLYKEIQLSEKKSANMSIMKEALQKSLQEK